MSVDQLAEHAVAGVRAGMIVGLGTGRAASRGIRALAERVRREHLSITCVATSRASEELAESLGLTVVPMAGVAEVGLLFDGADEVTPDLAMLKGAGGAMTREKIVAECARRRIYLVDDSKLVSRIGEKKPLPVEVLEYGVASASPRLRKIGLRPVLRQVDVGHPYRTDNGNFVLDCEIGDAAGLPLEVLDGLLNAIPSVVGHGLFVSQADEVVVETLGADGKATGIEVRRRGG